MKNIYSIIVSYLHNYLFAETLANSCKNFEIVLEIILKRERDRRGGGVEKLRSGERVIS